MTTKAFNTTTEMKMPFEKCSICEEHVQKIEEIEQILSGREDIIKALQCRLKKSDTNYQRLLGDFEQLRFEHSFALQDNFNLKEINSKLEEISKRHENYSVNQYQNPEKIISLEENQNYLLNNQAAFPPSLTEVSSLEEIVKKQNQTLKRLIDKVVKQLQTIKCEHSGCAVEYIYHIQNHSIQTESGDYKGIDPQFKELNDEIRRLKYEIDFQQSENERFRRLLSKKKSRLTKCTSLSTSIAPTSLPNIKKGLNMSYSGCCEKAVQFIRKELEKQEKAFEESTAQLIQQLSDVNNNNQILSDTLAIVTAENKNNLEIIKKLKIELNRTNVEHERQCCQLSCKVAHLEQVLEQATLSKKRLSDSVDANDAEAKNLKERLKQLINENKNLNNTISELENKIKKINPYEGNIEALRKELEEKNAELVEYEEENRFYCQKIEVLVNQNNELCRNIRQLEAEFLEKSKEVEKVDAETQSEFKDQSSLQNKVDQLDKENQYLLNQLRELQSLKTSNMSQVGQIAQMAVENDSLRKLLEKTKAENQQKLDSSERLIEYSQKEIERLSRELEKITNSGGNFKKDAFTSTSLKSNSSLNDTIDKLSKENRCLKEQCQLAEKLNDINKKQLEEISTLQNKNHDLAEMMRKLKHENSAETTRLQQLVDNSQNQVEILLHEHDQKTKEIEEIANELETIRQNVSNDTDQSAEHIKKLENEKEQLLHKLKGYENCKDCNCDQNGEINRLNAELIKKQIIIAELEESVDSFNDTLKNFDQTAEDLANENAALKADKNILEKNLERLQDIKKDFDNIKVHLEEIKKERDQLVQEKDKNTNKYNNLLYKLDQNAIILKNMEAERNSLSQELVRLKADKREMDKHLANYYHLQIELDGLKKEQPRNNQMFGKKISELQKVYDELKNAFDGLNEDNQSLRKEREKLNEELRNLRQELEECRNNKSQQQNMCNCLEAQNEILKNQTNLAIQELDSLKKNCEKLKADCALKCVEVECLKSDVLVLNKEKIICEQNCKQKLTDLKAQLEELQKNYEEKTGEVKNIKKQYESAAKSSQLTKDEYKNLKREYKDIKKMLSDQIKRYKNETGQIDSEKPCAIVKELKNQLIEKEKQIVACQQKLKDSSYEIIDLKDYIHKLICDNNILKSAINNLIGNLEKKIKGSGGSIAMSTEAIASEILTSLTNIEDTIIRNSDTGYYPCPKGCKGKTCNCMSEICSQYSFKDINQVPSSDICPTTKPCPHQPTKENSSQIKTTETEITTISKPSSKKRREESQLINITLNSDTTDSDDLATNKCLDEKSIDFFKEQIDDLKTRIDRTMKEKCCDCEQYFITTNSNSN
ncbi:desmoplakin-like [Anthonomus grandis grandis]|uniref:desmoplakin-like n=1 Tax=Anthonomus grandis grandis TaxID=2921223 RepID=UPI0021658BC8|nr:desmoplakin-like [Anthonomus grandis grandis]